MNLYKDIPNCDVEECKNAAVYRIIPSERNLCQSHYELESGSWRIETAEYIRKLEAVAELAKKSTCCTPSHEMYLALKELEKE